MSLNARKVPHSGGDYKPAPAMDAGAYPARLVRIMSVGLQPQRPYQGEEKPPRHEVDWTYEFLDEFLQDDDGNDILDKPRWMSESLPHYSLENTKAKSTARYYALDPDEEAGGDLTKLIGKPVLINITKNIIKNGPNKGKETNYISGTSTMRAKEAEKAPQLVNPAVVFDIDEPDMEVFNKLPKFMQEKMTEKNLEFPNSALDKAINGDGAGKSKAPEPEADSDEDW